MSYNSTTKIITAAVSIDDLKLCFQVVLAKKTDAGGRNKYVYRIGARSCPVINLK